MVGILFLAGLVLLAPPAEDPETTLALRRYLDNMGFRVAEADLPAPGGTLVLLHDLRDPDQARVVLDWVEQGGKLVLADPRSAVLELLGVSAIGPIDFVGTAELEPRCLSPDVVGVDRVTVRSSDAALRANGVEFVSCFHAGDGAFLLTRRHGEGTVTLLGGVSPLTNEMLADADNAVLAAQVVAPGPDVAFGPPIAPGDPANAGLWDFLPEGARVLVVTMVLSAVAFALVRARRLGSPVLEEPVAPIPASELVRATARMYRRAGAVEYCGSLLREATAARLSKRLWLTGRGEELPGVVAAASGLPEGRVRDILRGPSPRTDEGLIQVGVELEELAALAQQGSR